MSQISKKLRDIDGDGLQYWCQGCEISHVIWHGEGNSPRWGWNGDVDRPTFTPSVLVRRTMHCPPVTPENYEEWKANPWTQHDVEQVCHTFIKDGQVQFLGDCTHQFAGQTLDLPDLPASHQD